jgi:hypothetical protein
MECHRRLKYAVPAGLNKFIQNKFEFDWMPGIIEPACS